VKNIDLFKNTDGVWSTYSDVLERLKSVGASECDLLFVHTDIMFGIPSKELKRKEYLDALYNIFLDLGVGTLVFPAFTYSFCNHESFDVRNSRTDMGVLNEYIRKQPNVKRSLDPLLSMIVTGKQGDIFDGDLGHHSLGEGGGFDRIHHTPDVNFLFLGAEFSEYFTYVHYVEKMMNVPYRFDMPFTGTIIDYDGNAYEDTHYIHTGCGGVTPAPFYHFKEHLLCNGMMRTARLGDAEITCLSEEDAYREIKGKLQENIHYFLERPFAPADLTHEYTFGKKNERVMHC
jgi:aminoglycoside 3-N-acetyltransferase